MTPPDLEELKRRSTPGPWLARIAMLLGAVCAAGGLYAWGELSTVRDERARVQAQLDRASDGTVDEAVQRELVAAHRALGADAAEWGRRRLGLLLAAVILGLGGFFASGFRQLYAKTDWIQVDQPPSDG